MLTIFIPKHRLLVIIYKMTTQNHNHFNEVKQVIVGSFYFFPYWKNSVKRDWNW